VAFAAAADVAARILLPDLGELDAVVLGGSRPAVEQVTDDRRLQVLRALVAGPFLDVPDPRLAVLERTPAQFRAVLVRITEPPTADRSASG
jgi:hypothetical protein